MKINYSFLKDELALLEIRKHKWIESEKAGREIGFASAAVDWIKKYGNQFRQFRFGLKDDRDHFSEKRIYRRFHFQCPVYIKIGKNVIASQTQDINLIGFRCLIPYSCVQNSSAEVTIAFPLRGSAVPSSTFQFKSQIQRVLESPQKSPLLPRQIFLPFNEKVRAYLRAHADLITAFVSKIS